MEREIKRNDRDVQRRDSESIGKRLTTLGVPGGRPRRIPKTRNIDLVKDDIMEDDSLWRLLRGKPKKEAAYNPDMFNAYTYRREGGVENGVRWSTEHILVFRGERAGEATGPHLLLLNR